MLCQGLQYYQRYWKHDNWVLKAAVRQLRGLSLSSQHLLVSVGCRHSVSTECLLRMRMHDSEIHRIAWARRPRAAFMLTLRKILRWLLKAQ